VTPQRRARKTEWQRGKRAEVRRIDAALATPWPAEPPAYKPRYVRLPKRPAPSADGRIVAGLIRPYAYRNLDEHAAAMRARSTTLKRAESVRQYWQRVRNGEIERKPEERAETAVLRAELEGR
jgi:hypothetical protein